MKSEQINELAKALALAQKEITGSAKTGNNPHFRSDYSELSDVWEACRDPLTKNGLSVTQFTGVVSEKQILYTLLLHSSGQWIQGEYILAPERSTPQGFGSAITYARRYCLAAMVGVCPKDDDGNESMKTETPKEKSDRLLEKHGAGKPPVKLAENPSQITEKQFARMWAIASKSSWSEASLKVFCKEKFNIVSSKNLTKVQYEELCNYMETHPFPEFEESK